MLTVVAYHGGGQQARGDRVQLEVWVCGKEGVRAELVFLPLDGASGVHQHPPHPHQTGRRRQQLILRGKDRLLKLTDK
eukprot:3347575-Pyramimonas_sp.AAC.1